MSIAQIHAAAVCAWFGVIGAEVILELHGRDPAARRVVAAVHQWIDLLLEGPLVLLVLATGAVLVARAWPLSPLLIVKVIAGLVAIIANMICIPLVRMRAAATDDRRMLSLSRQVTQTGFAIPVGVFALVLGFGFFSPG